MSFITHFSIIRDPRTNINVKHNFLDILFLTISAIMSGAEGWKDIEDFGKNKITWLKKYRSFKHGIPVDDTIARIISLIEPEQLNIAFLSWVNEIRNETGKPHIAIDGKTLKHAYNPNNKLTALHSITAWSRQTGLVLGQLKSKGKKNENESVLELLDILHVKGALITADAMNTQKKIVNKIIEKGGDYLLNLKNNQKKLLNEVKAYFFKEERDNQDNIQHFKTTDSDHGRIETRIYSMCKIDKNWITESNKWLNLTHVIKVERERIIKKDQSTTTEIQYYITSCENNLATLADSIRGHWEVENKVHWILDVNFKEDACKIYKKNGAENLAVFRRFCLNMSRLHPSTASMRRKLKISAYSDEFRGEIIFG